MDGEFFKRFMPYFAPEKKPAVGIHVFNRVHPFDGGLYPLGTVSSNLQRFLAGPGKSLILSTFENASFLFSAIKGNDNELIYLTDTVHRDSKFKGATEEPVFRFRSIKEWTGKRTVGVVLAGNKKRLEGDKFSFRTPDEKAPPAEPWEWRGWGDGMRATHEKPVWPEEPPARTAGIPVPRKLFFEILMNGLQLPEIGKRRFPESAIRRHAGFARGYQGGPVNLRHTFIANAKRRIPAGVWSEWAIRQMENIKEREIVEAIEKDIATLLHMASYGHKITARLREINTDEFVAKHKELIKSLRAKRELGSYFHEEDIRTKMTDTRLNPTGRAVMFFVWDGNATDIAKRAAALFYRLIATRFSNIDVHLIKNDLKAEVLADEDALFGGNSPHHLVASSGYQAIDRIINENYRGQQNHYYLLHVGKGHTHADDLYETKRLMATRILPAFQQVLYIMGGFPHVGNDLKKLSWEGGEFKELGNLHYCEIQTVAAILPEFAKCFPAPRMPEAAPGAKQYNNPKPS